MKVSLLYNSKYSTNAIKNPIVKGVIKLPVYFHNTPAYNISNAPIIPIDMLND